MASPLDAATQHLLRDLAPQVLGIVTRRFRDFAAAEDAVQEALVAATQQWPEHGVPERAAARESYRKAAARTTSVAEREYLLVRAGRLGDG